MINLSIAATHEIKRLQSKQPTNNLLRLQIKSGGCADWFYDLSFDTIVKPEDQYFEINGISLVIDNTSLNYIQDLFVDYSEDLMGGAFRFHNSQATSTCGCGNSFSFNAG